MERVKVNELYRSGRADRELIDTELIEHIKLDSNTIKRSYGGIRQYVKASDLINILNELVSEHGDCFVINSLSEYSDEFSSMTVINERIKRANSDVELENKFFVIGDYYHL